MRAQLASMLGRELFVNVVFGSNVMATPGAKQGETADSQSVTLPSVTTPLSSCQWEGKRTQVFARCVAWCRWLQSS